MPELELERRPEYPVSLNQVHAIVTLRKNRYAFFVSESARSITKMVCQYVFALTFPESIPASHLAFHHALIHDDSWNSTFDIGPIVPFRGRSLSEQLSSLHNILTEVLSCIVMEKNAPCQSFPKMFHAYCHVSSFSSTEIMHSSASYSEFTS